MWRLNHLKTKLGPENKESLEIGARQGPADSEPSTEEVKSTLWGQKSLDEREHFLNVPPLDLDTTSSLKRPKLSFKSFEPNPPWERQRQLVTFSILLLKKVQKSLLKRPESLKINCFQVIFCLGFK